MKASLKGKFIKQSLNFWIVLLLGGIASVGFYVYIYFYDPTSRIELLFFLILGILMWLLAIPCLLFNRKAFIIIDDDSIKAKYNWFGKIDCKISDVVFVTTSLNTLTIELKDGSRHSIMEISNPRTLASYIQRRISFSASTSSTELIKKINDLRRTKKRGWIFVCAGIALMFIIIFVTVALTGGRDMPEFTDKDWMIFATMCILELIITPLTFYFARKVGKCRIPEIKLEHDIRRTIIETNPLFPGNAMSVFTDDLFTTRLTVYKHDCSDSVYYIMETLTPNYELQKEHESELFDDIEDLGALPFIDISKKFIS